MDHGRRDPDLRHRYTLVHSATSASRRERTVWAFAARVREFRETLANRAFFALFGAGIFGGMGQVSPSR